MVSGVVSAASELVAVVQESSGVITAPDDEADDSTPQAAQSNRSECLALVEHIAGFLFVLQDCNGYSEDDVNDESRSALMNLERSAMVPKHSSMITPNAPPSS